SRGLLVRDLLGRPGATEASAQATRELDTGRYAGCNVLCVDASAAFVIHAGDWLRVRPLPPGLHVLANHDINDPSDRRVAYTLEVLGRKDFADMAAALDILQPLAGSHHPPEAPICFRREKRGTVCSSLIALPEDLTRAVFRHAHGPPDVTPFVDYSPRFHSL